MKQKIRWIHPNFILGILAPALFFASGVYIPNASELGVALAISSLILIGVHWIWSMRDAWKDPELKNKVVGNYLWLTLIIMIPPLAGMMYYMIHDKRVSL